MFVSSYNTYIATNTNDKPSKSRVVQEKSDDKSFAKTLTKTAPILQAYDNKNIPINYISNYKSFANQQKLQEQVKTKDEIKFQRISAMKTAKVSYESNSKMFSLVSLPKTPINQTLKINDNLSQNIKELKEKNARYKMVNTYLANDKYYQITA